MTAPAPTDHPADATPNGWVGELAEMYTCDPDDESDDGDGDGELDHYTPTGHDLDAAWHRGFDRGRRGDAPGVLPRHWHLSHFFEDGHRVGREMYLKAAANLALEPYPPAGWHTQRQQDAAEWVEENFTVSRVDGTQYHLFATGRVFHRRSVDAWQIPAGLPVFEKAFSRGVVIDLNDIGA